MIVQGRRDVQVLVQDAQTLKTALPAAQLVLFEAMNHGFKDVNTNSMQEALLSYSSPDAPLTPGLASTIARFIKYIGYPKKG
jgi:hypothetical protein